MGSTVKSTRELLARYAVLLNQHGADSPEAAQLLARHRDNAEFVKLAELSRKLKAALVPDRLSGGIVP